MISIVKFDICNAGIDERRIESSSSDEIVIRMLDDEKDDLSNDAERIKVLNLIAPIKVEKFKLVKMGTDKFSFFVKQFSDGRVDIKGVNSAYMPEVIRFLNKESIVDGYDNLFYLDGRLCQFKEPLF